MSQTTAQAPKKEKVGIGAWIALVVLIVILSGVFRTSDTPLKVLDFTNLSGSFGTIGATPAPTSSAPAARAPRTALWPV